jgi:pimeloyl-ACP methyl ester carboxylesterase
MFKTRLARRIFKGMAVLVMLGVLGVGMLFGSLWLERRTDVTLPVPTGPFAVGRAIYDWADAERSDALAPVRGTRRELLVWIWYPAAAGPSVAMMDLYVPASMQAPAPPINPTFSFIQRLLVRFLRLLTRDSSKVRSHSASNADMSPQQRSYPVTIMRAGASSGVLNYTVLAEDLASHGYIVVGFDAPYRTGRVVFPDGRVIAETPENNPERCVGLAEDPCINPLLAAWTADVGFVLDRLQQLNLSDPSGKFMGRLDLTRVGVFGHSFGGAQAAQFCNDDPRCKAGIDIDGAPLGSVVQAKIRQPFMFLLSDHSRESDPESRRIMANIQSIYDRLAVDSRSHITIRGAAHFAFCDDGALFKSHVVHGVARILGNLRIDPRRQLAVTAYCLHSFFDAYLKGPAASRPKLSSPLYPEIEVLE